ncbi:MAG: hypothetical protein ABJF04_17240 [Reichenbachiella sp.]|uniref:hypothetical protein n=1 Tax=Reichenbachiella sp. TaxID=2184521 RepID=UPI003265D517
MNQKFSALLKSTYCYEEDFDRIPESTQKAFSKRFQLLYEQEHLVCTCWHDHVMLKNDSFVIITSHRVMIKKLTESFEYQLADISGVQEDYKGNLKLQIGSKSIAAFSTGQTPPKGLITLLSRKLNEAIFNVKNTIQHSETTVPSKEVIGSHQVNPKVFENTSSTPSGNRMSRKTVVFLFVAQAAFFGLVANYCVKWEKPTKEANLKEPFETKYDADGNLMPNDKSKLTMRDFGIDSAFSYEDVPLKEKKGVWLLEKGGGNNTEYSIGYQNEELVLVTKIFMPNTKPFSIWEKLIETSKGYVRESETHLEHAYVFVVSENRLTIYDRWGVFAELDSRNYISNSRIKQKDSKVRADN